MTGFVYLLLFQLLGELVSRSLSLPIPGAVLGMLFLFAGLLLKGHVPDGLEKSSGFLLRHLSLLFVPAGVGLVKYLPLLREQGLVMLSLLILSMALTLVISGWWLQHALHKKLGAE